MSIDIPEFAVLELTYRCNHRCIFCSCPWEADETYEKQEMSSEEWKKVVDTLIRYGVRMFSLSGGEVLLRSDLKELISYIVSRPVTLNLVSNGRNIDDDFLDFIAEKRIPISISVPGLETYKEHTGIDNSEHILSLFQKTKERGIDATANIAVTKKNLPELYENIAYPLLYGADYILLNRFLPGGRGLSNTEFLLTIDEVNEMLDIAEEVLEKAGRYGHVGTELPLCAIKHPERYEHIRIGTICAAGKGLIVVDPSGYLRVCNHSPTPLCRYDEIESLKKDPYWIAFRDRTYIPEMCRGCEKWGECDGGCRESAHAYFGSITDRDPLFQ